MRHFVVVGAFAFALPLVSCSSQPSAPPANEPEQTTAPRAVATAPEVVLVQLTGLT